MPTSQGYIFYILQHFTAELCNFTKHRMLFQAVVIFLPILNFFQISCKGGKVHFGINSLILVHAVDKILKTV